MAPGAVRSVRTGGGRGDADGTRARLLDEAERRFARRGVATVTSREITEAAGQRNTSAISYHFGSREGLLLALLARRGGPVDERRGALRTALGPAPGPAALVRCLVEPYAALLDDPGGRSYVRIVAQLRGRFASWRVESDVATAVHLASILDELESLGERPAELRAERVVAMIMLITASTAERARRIDDDVAPLVPHGVFVDELVAMCTAVIDA
jgi:TetR/AcrR family transcriptional regulator, regulator of cefoperazone and chloramphenicol sensitivity